MIPRTLTRRPSWPLQSSWLRALVRGLLPSFVADIIWRDQKPTWKVHPTSYLDGLRGLASVLVFFCHYTEENHNYFVPSYGLNGDGQPSSWLQLPFLRILYSGRPMVHIFFIISGFALSYKPIKCIHAHNVDACFSALASSTFRRPFRLFGPCIVSTFMIMVLMQTGYLYEAKPTMNEQFWAWTDAVFHSITWPWAWDWDLRPAYDVHLWTIPIEFVHSMLLFLVILMLARVRQFIRIGSVLFLMLYFLACGKWAAFEFIGGMFLAEMFLMRTHQAKAWESSDMTSVDSPSPRRRLFMSIAKTAYHTGVLIAFLFIGGWPNWGADQTPGIRVLQVHTPNPFAHMDELAPQKFWFAIAAAFAVWSCGELRAVKAFLEGPFAQYCGRISYAIYIVHGPVLGMFQRYVIGDPLTHAAGEPGTPDFRAAVPGTGVKGYFGAEGPTQQTVSWIVGLLILGPVVTWAADVFWRAVDNPVVAVAKKLEAICLDDSEPSPRSLGYSLAG